MIGDVAIIDSDTLSELSRGHARVIARARAYLEMHGRLTISAVTVFERLRGYRDALRRGKPFELQMQSFEALASSCFVLPVDAEVADRAATIWVQAGARGRRALGDILIAATASVHGMPLVTRNSRDFLPMARFVDLAIVDWTR